MINWDELKHIHVVRKLEDILAGWFNTDVFFVDEKGEIKNFDIKNKKREFKNPFANAILSKQAGQTHFFKTLAEANEKAFKSEQNFIVLAGPAKLESFVISKIIVEGEFLGSVVAYSYLEREPSSEQISTAVKQLEEMGMDHAVASAVVKQLKPISESQKKYFYELVNLVSQEIVTLHTEISKREERINALSNQLGNRYSYGSMIGKSKTMQQVYVLLDKIKNSESTVLIQGENGTGKELIAKAIHFNSSRKNNQFVTVNCSAFNENLLDSELFGHMRGSFTGAVKDKKGLFEVAHNGTLFLDEIGDMPASMQVKLLRVLQEGTFIPVGATEQKKVNVRVLAATNKDLKEMVEEGTFREDLYYRINVINLIVPPLRDRKEDIPVLVDHFLSRGCKEKNLPLKDFSKRAMEKFYDYAWPGNIRELENEVERLIVLSGDDKQILPELISARIRDFGGAGKAQGVRVSGKLKDSLEELEKTMIKEGLRRTNWNKSKLAKELGISRAGLIMKVEKYGLDKRRLPRSNGDPDGSEEAA